jgi:hypothetical protein
VPGRGALDERGGQLEAELVAVLVDAWRRATGDPAAVSTRDTR